MYMENSSLLFLIDSLMAQKIKTLNIAADKPALKKITIMLERLIFLCLVAKVVTCITKFLLN